MKFYFENNCGDQGTFEENDLVKAIYTAWNIEATLYLVEEGKEKLIFSPWDDNELNSDLLEEYGYFMEDGQEEREIKEIATGKVVKFEFKEVTQLNGV